MTSIIKSILLSFIFFALVSCHKSEPTSEPLNKYFNPDDLLKLNLDSVPNFWENNNLKISYNFFPYVIYPEENNKGIQVFSKSNGINNTKSIGVSVFETQEKAITGMRMRIVDVSGIINEGIPNNYFSGKWWYSDGSTIFVNQWNTIIEITISQTSYQDVEKELMEKTDEIDKRVDQLSSIIK